jgi:hypothetical protein
MSTKQDFINKYNQKNPTYHITGLKKLEVDSLEYAKTHHPKSLDELYSSYSDAKYSSWRKILEDYKPQSIIGLQGSSMAYSVKLIAENGDVLWITRNNNYLVEVI